MAEAAAQGSAAGSRVTPLDIAIGAVALSAPLIASLVNLLRFNDYPLTAAEVWPVYAVLLALGVGASTLCAFLPWPVRAAAETLAVALAVDINVDGPWPVLAAVVLAVGLTALGRKPLTRPIAFAATVMLLLCLLGVGSPARATPSRWPLEPRSNQPVLLHLILDEHIGLAGLPKDNPATAQERQTLTRHYVDRGFRVYGGAYSQHMRTTNAIPQIVNFGEWRSIRADNRGGGLEVSKNAYFDLLRKRGYQLRVYETGWVDLCAHDPSISCFRYPESGLRAVAKSGLSTRDKTGAIWLNFLGRAGIANQVSVLYSRFIAPKARAAGLPLRSINLGQMQLTSTLEALSASQQLLKELEQARPGQAYVAHLLLPHYPYVTRRDCSLKPLAEWRYRRFGADIRRREAAYFDQVGCAASLVARAEEALRRSPAAANYVIIVHGDHGSRITKHDPAAGARASTSDMVAAYSTHFAVRAPGVEPGYVPGAARVDDLLAQFVTRDFEAPLIAKRGGHVVLLEDARWRPVAKVAMPEP